MARKSLKVRLLGAPELDAYSQLACEHGCVFDTLRWTSLFEPNLFRFGVYDAGDNLRGGFCLFEQRRFGLKLFRNPPYTPQIGPFFESRATNRVARTDEQRAMVEAMAGFLSGSSAVLVSLGLSQGITDCLPFYWRGWKVIPHYTYRIDLLQGKGALIAGFSKVRRNDVRKAEKDGIVVEDVRDTTIMRALAIETFARQDKEFPLRFMDVLFSRFPPGQSSYCLIALAAGRPVAGVYVVHDSQTAYYLIGGYANGAHHGAGALAMWSAILKAKELGLEVFDFEGSMIPPIERYFRGFGGVLTPVFGVHRAWLPLEIALKVRRRYRNRF